MRREPEFFGETELVLVYMARRLNDALKLEELLTGANIDFAVETGSYMGGMIFRRELTGAFFYVLPAAVEQATQVLLDNRYKPYSE
jgi:hypothetical protein